MLMSRVAACSFNAARTRASSAMLASMARDSGVSANSGRLASWLICSTQLSTDKRSVLSTRS
jgi:hypothetical protein